MEGVLFVNQLNQKVNYTHAVNVNKSFIVEEIVKHNTGNRDIKSCAKKCKIKIP